MNGEPQFKNETFTLMWTGSKWKFKKKRFFYQWDDSRKTWMYVVKGAVSQDREIHIAVTKLRTTTTEYEYTFNVLNTMLKAMPRDLVITLRDGSTFEAHSQLIRATCPAWAALLGSDTVEAQQKDICVADVAPATVRAFVDALYTGRVKSDACGVARLADKYRATKILDRCVDTIRRKLSKTKDPKFFQEVLKLTRMLPATAHQKDLARELFECQKDTDFEDWSLLLQLSK